MPIQGMPQYRCFKTVNALRIQEVRAAGYDSTSDENPIVAISFENPAFPPRNINLRGKPTPEAGWWYVQYEDGYISFSPAKAFEEGYVPMSDGSIDIYSDASIPEGVIQVHPRTEHLIASLLPITVVHKTDDHPFAGTDHASS